MRRTPNPPIGISSRMIYSIALICIAGLAAVSAYILLDSKDGTLIASVEKSWDWAFAMAIGYILGSSTGSRLIRSTRSTAAASCRSAWRESRCHAKTRWRRCSRG